MSSEQSGMSFFLRLLGYLRAYWVRLILACLCSACVAGLTAVYAWLAGPFVDGIIIEKDQFLLMVLPFAILGVAALKGVAGYGQNYLMIYIGNQVVADIRQQLFFQLLRLPVRFHDGNSSGRLVSKVLNDVNLMGSAIPGVVKSLLQHGLTALAMMGMAFYQNWKLTTLLLTVIPISNYTALRIGKRLRRLATRGQESLGNMASVLKEAFSGIRIVKAYGREAMEDERFQVTNQSLMRTSVKSGQLSALSSPLMEILGVSAVTLIIWYMVHLVINGAISPGAFFSFLAAIAMASATIRRLAGTNLAIQVAISAAQRVFDVLEQENEEERDRGRKTLPQISRSLEFRHVNFCYEGNNKPALTHIDLTVEAGKMVAFVGSSGSGKTTLVSLIPRFYDASSGAILIDGQDIRHVTFQSLRRQIGIVSQETILFDDTVRNNIAYGRLDASDEEVVAAAKAAYAQEFIESLPNGWDTMIGENGIKLSAGQRQRLAIARALLRNAPILILDEATSQLDPESERMIKEAVGRLAVGRTTLVVAHRLSTVQRADRIVVLNQGRIVGTGPHEELLRTCGEYQRLYLAQFHETVVDSPIDGTHVALTCGESPLIRPETDDSGISISS